MNRTLERLGVEDCACGYVASKTSELKGKKTAPECMVVNGTKCSRELYCVIVGIMPRDTYKRSKGTVHEFSAWDANWPLGARNERITKGAACER